MNRKLKYSSKYIKYARKSGCVKFMNKKCDHGKMQTLDITFREAEIFRYLVETSNWFLFEKDNKFLTLTDMFAE